MTIKSFSSLPLIFYNQTPDFTNENAYINDFYKIQRKKIAEAEVRLQKHSEVRPHSDQVYNYKALLRVGGEPPVLQDVIRLGAIFFTHESI